MPPLQDPRDSAFEPADLALLDALRQHDQGLRAILCTLARQGMALRRSAPARAAAWLDQLAPHPLLKGGQFLFDLLEWEDFMLDGAAPALLDAQSLRTVLDRLAGVLRGVGAALDGAAPAPARSAGAETVADDSLPPLNASRYLFHEVVLGAVALLTTPPKP